MQQGPKRKRPADSASQPIDSGNSSERQTIAVPLVEAHKPSRIVFKDDSSEDLVYSNEEDSVEEQRVRDIHSVESDTEVDNATPKKRLRRNEQGGLANSNIKTGRTTDSSTKSQEIQVVHSHARKHPADEAGVTPSTFVDGPAVLETTTTHTLPPVLPEPNDDILLELDSVSQTFSYTAKDGTTVKCSHEEDADTDEHIDMLTNCAALSFYGMHFSRKLGSIVFQGASGPELVPKVPFEKYLTRTTPIRAKKDRAAYVNTVVQHAFNMFPAKSTHEDVRAHVNKLSPQPVYPGAQSDHILQKNLCPWCPENRFFRTQADGTDPSHYPLKHRDVPLSERKLKGKEARENQYWVLDLDIFDSGGMNTDVCLRLEKDFVSPEDTVPLPPTESQEHGITISSDPALRELGSADPDWAVDLGIVDAYTSWGKRIPLLLEPPRLEHRNLGVQKYERGLAYFGNHHIAMRIFKRANDLIQECGGDLTKIFKQRTSANLRLFVCAATHSRYANEIKFFVRFLIRAYMLSSSVGATVPKLRICNNQRKAFDELLLALKSVPDDLKSDTGSEERLADTFVAFMHTCLLQPLSVGTKIASVLEQYLAVRWSTINMLVNRENLFTRYCAILRRLLGVTAVLTAKRASNSDEHFSYMAQLGFKYDDCALDEDDLNALSTTFEFDTQEQIVVEEGGGEGVALGVNEAALQKEALSEQGQGRSVAGEADTNQTPTSGQEAGSVKRGWDNEFAGFVDSTAFLKKGEDGAIQESASIGGSIAFLSQLEAFAEFLKNGEITAVFHRLFNLFVKAMKGVEKMSRLCHWNDCHSELRFSAGVDTMVEIQVDNFKATIQKINRDSLAAVVDLLPHCIREESLATIRSLQEQSCGSRSLFDTPGNKERMDKLVDLYLDSFRGKTGLIAKGVVKSFLRKSQSSQHKIFAAVSLTMGVAPKSMHFAELQYTHSRERNSNLVLSGQAVLLGRRWKKGSDADRYGVAWQLTYENGLALLLYLGLVRRLEIHFRKELQPDMKVDILERFMFCNVNPASGYRMKQYTSIEIGTIMSSHVFGLLPSYARLMNIRVVQALKPTLFGTQTDRSVWTDAVDAQSQHTGLTAGTFYAPDAITRSTGLGPAEIHRQLQISLLVQSFWGLGSQGSFGLQADMPFALDTARKAVPAYTTAFESGGSEGLRDMLCRLQPFWRGEERCINSKGVSEQGVAQFGDTIMVSITAALVYGVMEYVKPEMAVLRRKVNVDHVVTVFKIILHVASEIDLGIEPQDRVFMVPDIQSQWDSDFRVQLNRISMSSTWEDFERRVHHSICQGLGSASGK